MSDEFDPRLEGEIREALRGQPLVPAPRTLMPRVLKLIEERAALPWWRRSWWEWPLAAKAAFLLFAVAVAVLAGSGGPVVDGGVASVASKVSDWLASLGSLRETVAPLANRAGLLWEQANQSLLWAVLAVTLAMYLICVGTGTLLVRVVCHQRPQRWL